jgi:SAM-dependent methyltransferase
LERWREAVRAVFISWFGTALLLAALQSAKAQKSNSTAGSNISVTITNQLPAKVEVALTGLQQQGAPPPNLPLEWAKALGTVVAAAIAVIGVAVTAWITMRRGRSDARFTFAGQILEFRLRQLQEFYTPTLMLIEQSKTVYDKMLWTIKCERKDIPLDGFRLLDHIYQLNNDKNVGPLVKRVLEIGKQLTKLITRKSGLIEGGVSTTYSEYLAHFEILQAASEQNLSAKQKEGWHELGYYPRMLNREIREGYKVVLAHVEKYVAAGDRIIFDLLEQRSVDLEKYRRQLIANLTYYEQHAKTYATKFDKFDLSGIRQRFVLAVREKKPARNDEGLEGRILDAGCGTGRDAIEFIKLGFEVVAFDPSPAMLRYCNRKIREATTVNETELAAKASRSQELTFDEVSFRNEFDGIWAAASLLHIPTQLMGETLKILFRALKPNGVLFFSLKYGVGEHEWDARFYTYYGRQGIRDILQNISQTREIATWLTDSSGKDLSEEQQTIAWNEEQSGRYDQSLWLNVLVRKVRK